jgi:N-methylhydantoinase B
MDEKENDLAPEMAFEGDSAVDESPEDEMLDEQLAPSLENVQVALRVEIAGDKLVFRTAGAGGWGDPLERDPQLVLRDVLRDLVSREVALRDYGVVIDRSTVDRPATVAERTRLSGERGPIEPFDFGHAPTGGSA